MAEAITRQSAENMQYVVRRLLRQKQPGVAAMLESALMLAERELRPPRILTDISARDGS